jgi:prevent-host-death family protein
MRVNVLEAKNRLSELIRAAQAGEEVVIANRGKPVARLVAERSEEEAGELRPGSAAAILDFLDRYPVPEHARRTPEEIEAAIQDARHAWD